MDGEGWGRFNCGIQMPEATRDIQDSQDLEARVGELLSDMESTAVDAPPVPQAPPPPAAPRPMVGGAPRPEAEPAVATAVAIAPVPEVLPAEGAEDATGEGVERDLAKAVEKLLEEAPAGAQAAPPVTATAAALEAGKIDSLDAELAGLADDLISGEFADENAVLKSNDQAKPAPVPTEKQAAAPAAPATPAPAAAAAGKPEAPKPEAAPVPEAKAQPHPAEPARKPEVAKPRPIPEPMTEPSVLLKAMAAVSAPLSGKPQYIRDVIGWNALWVGFLAMCVWVYVLVFRSDEPAPPPPVTPAKADSGHGEKPVSHEAKPAKKPDAHGAKKAPAKKDTKTAKAGGH